MYPAPASTKKTRQTFGKRARRMPPFTRRVQVLSRCAPLAFVIVVSGAGAVRGADPAAAVRPVALRIDYLPNLLYDGERLTLCGAVVNRGAAIVAATVSCSLTCPGGPEAKPTEVAVAAPSGKEGRFQASWPVADLERPATLTVVLTIGEKPVDTAEAVVVPASLQLPALERGDGCVVNEEGKRVVLVVRRQVRERESKWLVVKLVRRALVGDKVRPASALLFGDLLAKEEGGSYVSMLRSSGALSRFSFLGVAHPTQSGRATHAILGTLCAFSRSALKRRYDFAILFVGSEEARFGTDVDEFRKAVDLMCGLLRARGCRHIAFAKPVAPARLERRVERYRRAVESVAHAAAVRVFDPQPAVVRAGWGNGPLPGADAQRAIADEMVRFVKAVTVK